MTTITQNTRKQKQSTVEMKQAPHDLLINILMIIASALGIVLLLITFKILVEVGAFAW